MKKFLAVLLLSCMLLTSLVACGNNDNTKDPADETTNNTEDKEFTPEIIPASNIDNRQIVVDYMASMTDDYCAELYKYLFPKSNVDIKYHGYFEDLVLL